MKTPVAPQGRLAGVSDSVYQNEYFRVTPYIRGVEKVPDTYPRPAPELEGVISASSSVAFLTHRAESKLEPNIPVQSRRASTMW